MDTITLTGDNLFAVAARLLGDATQWIRIAQLNDLRDPQIYGLVTLSIPSVQPDAGGGIATQ